MHSPGWILKVYTWDGNELLYIPSEFLQQTSGSQRYMRDLKENGAYMKMHKWQLCFPFVTKGSCPKGPSCGMIHTVHMHTEYAAAAATQVRSTTVHRFTGGNQQNETAKAGPAYPVHDLNDFTPASGGEINKETAVFAVWNPSKSQCHHFMPNQVYVTEGSKEYVRQVKELGYCTMRMQHCTHYRNKKYCNLGPTCGFIHVASMPDTRHHPAPASNQAASGHWSQTSSPAPASPTPKEVGVGSPQTQAA
jgi:hypothetical protein